MHDLAGIFPGHGKDILAMQPGRGTGAQQMRGQMLFDEFGLAFLDHQHRRLAIAKRQEFFGNNGVGDIQAVNRHLRRTVKISQTQPLQGADDPVIHAALTDDADRGSRRAEDLVQPPFADKALRGGPAAGDLVMFLRIGHRRQHDAADLAARG